MKSASKLFLFVLLLGGLSIGLQDLFVFPAMLKSGRFHFSGKLPPSPRSVEKFLVASTDDVELEAWHLVAPEQRKVAIIFHGEQDTLWEYYRIQQWLQANGISSYIFDYRGLGRSSGWPSERGWLVDARAVVAKIIEKEKRAASDYLIIGNSLGGTVAAHIAAELQSSELWLFAPSLNLRATVFDGRMPADGELLLFNKFELGPVLPRLKQSCVRVLYGEIGESVRSAQASLVADLVDQSGSQTQRLFSKTSAGMFATLKNFAQQLKAPCKGVPHE